MIQTVIFDLDDTLYDYDILDGKARENAARFTCKQLAISRKRYDEAYLFGRTETKRRLSEMGAGHNRLLYFQKMLEYLDVPPIPLSLQIYEQYWGVFLSEMKLYDGAKELLDYLKEKQISIVICTDLTAHIQHRKIEALGLAPYVRYLVSSEEAGKEKPAQEIFRLCLEKLKVPPETVLYVGDSFHKDVEGALRAGMKAVWFHPKERQTNMEGGTPSETAKYLQAENYAQIKELIVQEIG